jgi:hypothetical protein
VAAFFLFYDSALNVRLGSGHGDARDLCSGIKEPLVHLGLCIRLRGGIGLRISSRRLALWSGRGNLVRGCGSALVPQAQGCQTTSEFRVRADIFKPMAYTLRFAADVVAGGLRFLKKRITLPFLTNSRKWAVARNDNSLVRQGK